MEVTYGDEKKWYERAWDWVKSVPKKIGQVAKDHPGETMMLVASIITAGSTAAKIVTASKEYEDAVYLTDNEGNVNKIASKKLRTVKTDDIEE